MPGWKSEALQQQMQDVYHGPRGVLRGGAPLESAGFAALNAALGPKAQSTYSNAAATMSASR